MPKNSKRGHLGSLNVFTNQKLARGYPLIEFKNFRKNSLHSAVHPPPLASRLFFSKHKTICGLVRESNPRTTASQKIS